MSPLLGELVGAGTTVGRDGNLSQWGVLAFHAALGVSRRICSPQGGASRVVHELM
jgi:hypothetical protein